MQDNNMDTEDIEALVEDLSNNIDDLEDSLAPLLRTALSASTSKLPLLDKAKLYVLATYAIESILFSALRLNGVDAKSHPVFQELGRVKEYFAKIKAAEGAGQKRNTTVDKEAAGRFIRHGLMGNEGHDRELAERQASERLRAKRKLEEIATGTHTRFDGAAKRAKALEKQVPVVRAKDLDDDEDGMRNENKEGVNLLTVFDTAETEKSAKKEAKRLRRLERKLQEQTGEETSSALGKNDADAKNAGKDVVLHNIIEPTGFEPNTDNEVFQTLQQGSTPPSEAKKSKKRKKRKSRSEQAKRDEDARAAEMM